MHSHEIKTPSSDKLLNDLIKQKKLNIQSFKPGEIKLEDNISVHVAWVFDHIYSVPYPKEGKRISHDIMHVTRMLIYLTALLNLSQRYHFTLLTSMFKKNPRLLAIFRFVVLLHDAAREDDGIDYWDCDSGSLIYLVLTRVFQLDHKTAKFFAEIVPNKDMADGDEYYALIINETGDLAWKKTPCREKKNFDHLFELLRRLMNSLDILDIPRARNHFEGHRLFFYKETAEKNERAFDEMALLISDVKTLINITGDGRNTFDMNIKQNYSHAKAYDAISSVAMKNKTFLAALFANGCLLERDEVKEINIHEYIPPCPLESHQITAENINAFMFHGLLLARAIGSPSAIIGKKSLASIEIQYMYRPTGNDNRSTTLIGWNTPLYAGSGFLFNLNLSHIKSISVVDLDSGRGEKEDFELTLKRISEEEKRQQLAVLRRTMKMGGMSRQNGISYNEIISDLYAKDVECVFFTQEPNLHNSNLHGYKKPIHIVSQPLQAFFLKYEFHLITGTNLKLYEYSSTHNLIRPINFNDDDLVQMWTKMAKDWLCGKNITHILETDTDKLKVISMYAISSNLYADENRAADTNYPPDLRTKISSAIENERKRCALDYLINEEKKNDLSFFSDNVFYTFLCFRDLTEQYREKIENSIKNFIESKKFSDTFYEYFRDKNHGFFEGEKEKFEWGIIKKYYENNLIKAYQLSLWIDNKQYIDIIKNTVSDILLNIIEKTLTCASEYISYNLNYLTALAILFDQSRFFSAIYDLIARRLDWIIFFQNQYMFSDLCVTLKRGGFLHKDLEILLKNIKEKFQKNSDLYEFDIINQVLAEPTEYTLYNIHHLLKKRGTDSSHLQYLNNLSIFSKNPLIPETKISLNQKHISRELNSLDNSSASLLNHLSRIIEQGNTSEYYPFCIQLLKLSISRYNHEQKNNLLNDENLSCATNSMETIFSIMASRNMTEKKYQEIFEQLLFGYYGRILDENEERKPENSHRRKLNL